MIQPRVQRPTPATNAIAGDHGSRCLIFRGRDTARALHDPSEISDLLQDEHNFVWFDLAEPTAEDLALLQEEFSLHPTAVEERHAAAPVRDILAAVLRGDARRSEPALVAYFRDVHDHAVRATDQIDSIRELLNSTLDIHLSSEAHRQGEVSKQLTIIATILLPLTYITGFFGQNFGWMVNHIDRAADFFWIGIGSQLLAVVLLIGYFKRRGWF